MTSATRGSAEAGAQSAITASTASNRRRMEILPEELKS
jgi:hypothetical protein